MKHYRFSKWLHGIVDISKDTSVDISKDTSDEDIIGFLKIVLVLVVIAVVVTALLLNFTM